MTEPKQRRGIVIAKEDGFYDSDQVWPGDELWSADLEPVGFFNENGDLVYHKDPRENSDGR